MKRNFPVTLPRPTRSSSAQCSTFRSVPRAAIVVTALAAFGCDGAPEQKPRVSPAPAESFAQLEQRLLESAEWGGEFHVTAEGAISVDLRGRFDIGEDQIALTAQGQFGDQAVNLSLKANGEDVTCANGPLAKTGPRPAHLRESIIVGFTRMGVLHNLARLTGAQMPDHAEGGVREWVQVGPFDAQPPASYGFGLTVAGGPSGSATLRLDDAGLPQLRQQTVPFPGGEMRVREEYSGSTLRVP